MTAIAVAASIGFLSGLFVAAVAWGPLERRAKVPKIRRSEPKEERYGHPFPPVSRILKSLPEPPFPLQWESWVDRSDGGITLVIRLVDLTNPSDALETCKVDLLNYAPHGTTWAAARRKYSMIYPSMFDQQAVDPTVGWAYKALARRAPDPAAAVSDYRLGRK